MWWEHKHKHVKGTLSSEVIFQFQHCHIHTHTVAASQFRVAQRLSWFEGSSKGSPQMLLLFPVFGGCTTTIPSWPHMSQDSSHARKIRRKKEDGDITWHRLSLSRAWVAEIVTEIFECLSEGLAFKDHKDQVLRRMQTLNWDTATDVSSPSSIYSFTHWLP